MKNKYPQAAKLLQLQVLKDQRIKPSKKHLDFRNTVQILEVTYNKLWQNKEVTKYAKMALGMLIQMIYFYINFFLEQILFEKLMQYYALWNFEHQSFFFLFILFKDFLKIGNNSKSI